MSNMNIKVGYYNWHDFAKGGSFYPDDMPQEWRLSFYANEFECTQLCLSDVDNAADLDELVEDLDISFKLIINCGNITQWPLLQRLLDNSELCIAAVIVSDEVAAHFKKEIDGFSLNFIQSSSAQETDFSVSVKTQQLNAADFDVLYVTEMQNLKKWRLFIEQWMTSSKRETHYLLLSSESFNTSAASEIRMMIEMMGY